MEIVRTEGRSAVVLASRTQFAPGGSVGYSAVQSLMVLGCHRGHGEVVIDGARLRCHAGLLFIVPWGHQIEYYADQAAPFLVYGMHIVPWHDADRPIETGVVHGPEDERYDCAWRRPAAPGRRPVLTDLISSTETERPGLSAVVQYAIAVFERNDPVDPDDATLLGCLGMREIAVPSEPRRPQIADLPLRLRRLASWVHDHLAEPISLDTLAELDGSSRSTVVRLFESDLGITPIRWVIDQRISRACTLLASTSLTIAEISMAVGFSDQYYFSRMFRQRMGASPRLWRGRQVV